MTNKFRALWRRREKGTRRTSGKLLLQQLSIFRFPSNHEPSPARVLSGKSIGVADGGPCAARTMCSAAALLRLLFLGCSGLSSRTLSPSSTVRTVPWLPHCSRECKFCWVLSYQWVPENAFLSWIRRLGNTTWLEDTLQLHCCVHDWTWCSYQPSPRTRCRRPFIQQQLDAHYSVILHCMPKSTMMQHGREGRLAVRLQLLQCLCTSVFKWGIACLRNCLVDIGLRTRSCSGVMFLVMILYCWLVLPYFVVYRCFMYLRISFISAGFVSGMVFHRGGPGSFPGQWMWDLRWRKWHWDRFLTEYFVLILSLSFHRYSLLIPSLITRFLTEYFGLILSLSFHCYSLLIHSLITRFLTEYFGLILSLSFHRYSLLIHSLITDAL